MSLRIAIKIALGIAILKNPLWAAPAPVIVDSTEILSLYKKNLEEKLLDTGITEEEDAEYFRRILYNPKINTRDGIEKFSKWVESFPDSLGADPFPVYHKFGGGMYTREIHMPKGYAVVGKIHRHASMVYLLKGRVIVADENGTRVVCAPAQFVSSGGLKRIGYVLEDIAWIDIHTTDETNIEDAEKDIFADTYEELDMDSYKTMIEDMGYTEKEVIAISENTKDVVSDDNNLIDVRPSNIEGSGVFSAHGFNSGDVIGLARIKDNRTKLGRYTNHSFNPNSTCEVKNNSIYFSSLCKINKGDEITIDYKKTISAAKELDLMKTNNIGWLSCQA